MATRSKRDNHIVDDAVIRENSNKIQDTIEREAIISFADKLNKLMYDRDVSAEQLNAQTGISTGAISNYRRAVSLPNGANLIQIANFFNVS